MTSNNPRIFSLPKKKAKETDKKKLKPSNLLLSHLHQRYLNLHKHIDQGKK